MNHGKCALFLLALTVAVPGCQHPSITAVSLAPPVCSEGSGPFSFLHCHHEPDGIPFYLPKPLLIISKNFRNIEETKVGLTDTAPIPNFFDDQAKYADLNARTNFAGLDGIAPASGTPAATSGNEVFPTGEAKNLATAASARVYSDRGAPVTPGAVASDGLKPEAFFTYHIIFVPDLTQKYGLRIKGGAGEIRAAMNLVNGWQFTGLGPYYMKDSSTAQNTLAGGITANLAASGVADVVKAVAGLRGGAGSKTNTQAGPAPPQRAPQASLDLEKAQALVDMIQKLRPSFIPIPGFAEISIYEPYISPEGTMEWKLIAEKQFSRDVLGTSLTDGQLANVLRAVPGLNFLDGTSSGQANDLAPPPPAEGGASPLAPTVPGASNAPASPPPIVGPMSGLPPLSGAPGGSRARALPGPRVALTPALAPRRNAIDNQRPDAPKADGALVRTQAPPPTPLPPVAPTAPALPPTAPALPPTAPPLPPTAPALPPTAPPLPPTAPALPPTAPTAPALPVAAPSLGPGDVVVTESEAPVSASEAALHRDIMRGVLGQVGALGGAAGPTVVAPPPAPSATNQVNLHQYFGHTKVGGPVLEHPGKRFSLFHRKAKARPTVRTFDVGGLAPSATALDAAPVLATSPTGGAPAVVAGTGSGVVIPNPAPVLP